ncbi:MAG: tetraacyldisaccharide 4'-kinase [Bacteroidales bacterium]|nr:tetraacyldisaccharide 4'-kinase [Bacteroidales bacterium]
MGFVNDILLAPYSLILRLRHFAYDHRLAKSVKSPMPSVCIGNITVGGTGKTPHAEMLIRLLRELPQWERAYFALVSRGYKRKGKGFLEVTADGSSKIFGDEPLQIKKKFPYVRVVVDKDRRNACRKLAEDGIELVILDDAFQYRRLDADVKIVLVDYNQPIFKDSLMPFGRLRDLPSRLSKADMVLVTKCPSYMSREEADEFAKNLGFKGDIFFTTMSYGDYTAVFPEGDNRYPHSERLILFTGIANDEALMNYLGLKFDILRHLQFDDHHRFTKGDLNAVRRWADKYPTAVLMTTEKDAQRVLDCKNVPETLRKRLFYAPLFAEFLFDGKDAFLAALADRLNREPSTPSQP